MRTSSALLATICGAATTFNSSALTDVRTRTTVDVRGPVLAQGASGNACSRDGCTPGHTRDNSRDANSRWSCVGTLVTDTGGCRIEYSFQHPQDIDRIRIAFHKGDENVRVLDVFVDGKFHRQISSSGDTLGYQNFVLYAAKTSKVTLRLADHADKPDEWISITEVKFMVE